jgi:hypothetical protein
MACTDREIAAFLIVPLTVPIFAILRWPETGALGVIVAVTVSYGAILIFGFPMYLILRSRHLTGLWIATAMGLLIGVLAWFSGGMLIALLFDQGISGARAVLADANWRNGIFWPGGAVGALVGILFWIIARPDRLARQDLE